MDILITSGMCIIMGVILYCTHKLAYILGKRHTLKEVNDYIYERRLKLEKESG